MPKPLFTSAMAHLLIGRDDSPLRFENFCIDLFTEEEGITFVPTSRSYDLSRDGRPISTSIHGPQHVICCSLNKSVFAKAKKDFESLIAHVQPRAVRFCFNSEVSQTIADKIRKMCVSQCSRLRRVEVEDLTSLVRFAERHPDVIPRHYRGELSDLRDTLSADDREQTGDAELNGMRIALTTQLHDDAAELRRDTVRNLLLLSLSHGNPMEAREIADAVSKRLYLPRRVREEYLHQGLTDLHKSGGVVQQKGHWRITGIGQDELRSRRGRGYDTLLEGRTMMRRLLKSSAGLELTDDQYALVWRTLQDAFATLFLERGTAVTLAIASMVEEEKGPRRGEAAEQKLGPLLRSIAARISRSGLTPVIANRVADVFPALFNGEHLDAVEWLAGLGAVYMTVCALGLEPNAQEQVAAQARKVELVLDTDVVLSHLSGAEQNHSAVSAIVKTWRDIGGGILISRSVLEEAAYHAWISQRCYEQVWRDLESVPAERIAKAIKNVFVRGFWAAAPADGYGPTEWKEYIGNFRGRSERDFKNLLEALGDDGVEQLPDLEVDDRVRGEVEQRLAQLRASPKALDLNTDVDVEATFTRRCLCDGEIVSLLLARRRMLAGSGTSVVVSTSEYLRQAFVPYQDMLGSPEPVMTVAAIGYVLALLPGVRLSLRSLRGVLFDGTFSKLLPSGGGAKNVLRSARASPSGMARASRLRSYMRERFPHPPGYPSLDD
jgi:hypothetical protein